MRNSIAFPRRAALALAVSMLLPSFHAAAQSAHDPLPVSPSTFPPTQRLIVRFHDNVAAASPQRLITRTMDAAIQRAGVATAQQGRLLRSDATYVRRLGNGAELLQLPASLDAPAMQRLVAEIAADPAVRYVEPDTLQRIEAPATATFVPDDPQYASHQWHLHDAVGGVNAPAAWEMSRGQGVVVAVIDTGILPEHPDFDRARVLPGYDFITDTFISRRPNPGRVAGALDYGDWNPQANECFDGSQVQSSSWHGTHVAATIGQATDNGIGMAGLAPEVTLLPVRTLGRCGGWTSDIADAVVWSSGGPVPGVPDNAHPADIINLSLGGVGACSRAYQEAIDLAVARGSVVVVAAGNSTVDVALRQPASCGNIVNVGATGATGRIAGYSNFGAGVDLSGPGGDFNGPIRGLVWQNGYSGATTPTSGAFNYAGKAGTSMAAPHVAATAALVQSARVAAGRLPLSPARMEALLVGSARAFPVAPPANKPIGSGIVDASAALRMALDEACDIATTSCTQPVTLVPQVSVSGQSGDAAGRRYTFRAQAGRPLRVFTYGGKGNAALYVRQGAPAQPDRFDQRSARIGSHQTVRVAAPVAGEYHVLLKGAPTYEGVTVMVSQ